MHVDSPTSSEKVINLNDLPNIDLNPNLVPYPPTKRLKKSYDHTQKFQLEWVVKLFWAEGVLTMVNLIWSSARYVAQLTGSLVCFFLNGICWWNMKVGGRQRRIFQSWRSWKEIGTTTKLINTRKVKLCILLKFLLLSCNKSTRIITWS